MHCIRGAKVTRSKGGRERDFFEEELLGTRVIVKLVSGEVIEGEVVETAKYWVKLKSSPKQYTLTKHT